MGIDIVVVCLRVGARACMCGWWWGGVCVSSNVVERHPTLGWRQILIAPHRSYSHPQTFHFKKIYSILDEEGSRDDIFVFCNTGSLSPLRTCVARSVNVQQ